MSEELEVLRTVTQRLDRAQIRYMVTGSMAANFYAVPRMTRDIDIVVELSEVDVDRVVGLFQGDFYVDREMVQRAIREKAMFNIIQNAFVIKVDFVVKKESEYRREEFSRRRPVSMESHEFFIVAPEDLILSKLEWARDRRSPLHLDDVRNLLRSVQGLDKSSGPLGESVGPRATLPGGLVMRDTSSEMEQRYRAMLLQRSGVERLKMGCSMHATAQALVRASILEKEPHASSGALRRALFLRFYGQDFDPQSRERILRALDQSGQ